MSAARIERTREALRDRGWMGVANHSSDSELEGLIRAVELAAWDPDGTRPPDDRTDVMAGTSVIMAAGDRWRNKPEGPV